MDNGFWWAEQAARLMHLLTGRTRPDTKAPDRASAPLVSTPTHKLLDPRDHALMDRVRRIVDEQLGNANFGVEWLACEMNLSTRQLQRRVRTAAGVSAAVYIRTARIQHAARLLQYGSRSVAEISCAVGYRDPRHFARLFRETFGETPTRYRVRMWQCEALSEQAVAS